VAEFEAFAAYQFELAAPGDDGVAAIEHLRAVEERTGVTPKALLDAPPCPEGCEELWRAFGELHACRGSNGFGPNRITYTDLDAFQRVTGVRLARWELAAIRRADRAYLSDWAARQPKS
jgi:hypothetical protein